MLILVRAGRMNRFFHSMFDTIHIDEKWFYLHKLSNSYILTADETVPYIPCENKRFVTKVMFIAAVARPRFNYERNEGFDGKLGIFPIVGQRLAVRTTKNQCAGELITEAVTVDKVKYRELLLDKILPAIQSKWPGERLQTWNRNASPLT